MAQISVSGVHKFCKYLDLTTITHCIVCTLIRVLWLVFEFLIMYGIDTVFQRRVK